MKPAKMTHTIQVVAVKYIPGNRETGDGRQGDRPQVALLFMLEAPGGGMVPCWHELPVSKARPLGIVLPGVNAGRFGWFMCQQTIECRIDYHGTRRTFDLDFGPLVKQPDGSYSTAQPASFHHAKITRYGTITGGVRQTEADLQAAFAMGIHG